MMKEKEVPLKNYILLAVILLLSIIIIIYFYIWHNTYEESKLTIPIMDKYMQVINYNELNDYLIENKDCIIYSSVLNNQEIRNFEIKLKKVIVNKSLENNILYLDLTEELKNNNLKKEIENKYKDNNNNSLVNVPSIAVFKSGTLESIYLISKNDYEIDPLVTYLKEEGIIND